MLLGPITLIDCLVFLVFLAPQLLLSVGLGPTIKVGLQCVPFFLVQLPYQLVEERFWRDRRARSAWAQGSSFFEDLVIRCVRFAFANIPPAVGSVFFSKRVAVPFMRWRMLRHGYIKYPVHVKEVEQGVGNERFKGVWMTHKPHESPDLVFYYIHGGGFVLGSSYFYLEVMTSIHHLLLRAGFRNPAIFALEYTLAPGAVYPVQLEETIAAYRHVLGVAGDPSKVCLAGDSAGATLALSLLLEIAGQGKATQAKARQQNGTTRPLPVPQSSILISPWVTIKSHLHKESDIDFLDRDSLWEYGFQYARGYMHETPASPGVCVEGAMWQAASPKRGFFVVYGDEEVFAPDVEDWMKRLSDFGVDVDSRRFSGDCGIHAWPVVSLFLSDTEQRRMDGLQMR